MEDKNFFCEITKSEMGYDEDVFLYFSIMDELTALIAEIKTYDKNYKNYDDVLEFSWKIPDYEYENIEILKNIDMEKYRSYRATEILKHCNMASILLYKAYSKTRIALNCFVKVSHDKRFNILFNNENLILLKGLKDFFLYRFFEINEK